MKKLLTLLIIYTVVLIAGFKSYGQELKIGKDTSLVPKAILAQLALNSQEGCNFNNWPNPLKGSTITYPAPVNGNGYDGSAATQWNCITTRANQTWFYVRILTTGNIRFVFNNTSNVDVDAILWGPVANGNIAQACSATQSAPLVCDYNESATVELPCTSHSTLCGGTLAGTIPVQAGQVYVMCVLNYANRATNITLSQPIGGSVYYSQESQEIAVEHFSVNNGDLNDKSSLKNASSSEDNGVFKVCADGAVSSMFKVTTATPNLKARIAQDPNEANIPLYGKFTNNSFANGIYEIIYKHPDYVSSISTYSQYNIEFYSQDNPTTVVSTYPIRVHPTPLLMIHGLWSNGTQLEGSSFETLERFLQSSTAYNVNTNVVTTKLYGQIDYYTKTNDSFASNANIIPDYLSKFKSYLKNEGYATSKFDIIGHSMGGILSRLYLQSNQYKNDFHKLMTVNTPHSGSQMANFLSNSLNTVDGVCEYIRTELMNGKLICQSDAVDDLQVNSAAIASLNNGVGTTKTVPSHAIATTFPVSTLLTGLSRVPKVGMLAYLINTGISVIFAGEENDIIVALSSQLGGLPANARSRPSSFAPHMGAQGNSSVITQIKNLLGYPTTNLAFTRDGFRPPILTYGIPTVNKNIPFSGSSTITITQPANNIRVNRRGTLTFQISATNVTEINVVVDYDEDEVMSYKAMGTTANFTLPIDVGFSIGKHSAIAIGKAADGSTVSQKISFEVTDCVSDYNPLNGNLIKSFYQAQNIIVTDGQIPFGQNIQMNAGKYVELKTGFQMDSFAIFNVQIGGCN